MDDHDMLNAFEAAIAGNSDYAGQAAEIGAFANDAGAITIAEVANNAETDPAFELFSMVIGTLDDINVANGALQQDVVDPVVSYDSTSLMNMPKSAFDDMIDQIQVELIFDAEQDGRFFFLKFKNFTKSLIKSSQCNFDENY